MPSGPRVRYWHFFGRDRRVGAYLLLREERKSGLWGSISVFDPKETYDRDWYRYD